MPVHPRLSRSWMPAFLLAALLPACGGGGGSTASTGAPAASFSYVSATGSADLLRSGHAITFTGASTGSATAWSWDFGDGTTGTGQSPVHIFDVPATAAGTPRTFTVTLLAAGPSGSWTASRDLVVCQPEFNLYQGISDQAQGTTISFSGFAMLTGNLHAQTFFPPGKVADYTGFQYLRDNDPTGMGHNTSFVTKLAGNVIHLLTGGQIARLAALATGQQDAFKLYGYERYTLMKAFRMVLEGTNTTALSLAKVKAYSSALYQIDGQISYDRAKLYADVLGGMSSDQLASLDAMKGRGWGGWPELTADVQADIDAKMKTLPGGTAVLVMTYAGDIFSWYEGSVDADVYFCPERHGTYYGGFYMKDAPAIGHEGYSISTTLTATAGSVLLGTDGRNSTVGQAPYYVTQAQADLMAGLTGTQKDNLTGIVSVRSRIATLLRSLLAAGTDADAVKTQVLALSGTYGELDGEDNYHCATVFAQIHQSLTTPQKTALADLRSRIMTGTYADGTPFDFTTCSMDYLYSDPVTDAALLVPYTSDTALAALFESSPLPEEAAP